MNKAKTRIITGSEHNASADLQNIQRLMRALGDESASLGAAMTQMGERLPVERLRETVALMERLGSARQTAQEASPGSALAANLGNTFYITINALDARDVEGFFRERLDPYLQRRSRDGYDMMYSEGLRQVS